MTFSWMTTQPITRDATLLNAEVQKNLGEDIAYGKVTQCALGADEKAIGTYNDNPALNTMIYEVESPDGQVKEYLANIIVENMVAQAEIIQLQ